MRLPIAPAGRRAGGRARALGAFVAALVLAAACVGCGTERPGPGDDAPKTDKAADQDTAGDQPTGNATDDPLTPPAEPTPTPTTTGPGPTDPGPKPKPKMPPARPPEGAPATIPIEWARPIGDGTTLRIGYWIGVAACSGTLDRAKVTETTRMVSVTLLRSPPPPDKPDGACIQIVEEKTTDVRLDAPLGDRGVLNAVNREKVPRSTQQ